MMVFAVVACNWLPASSGNLASGFLTQSNYNVAVATAQAWPVP
jgi:hypothetical protein